MTWATRRRIVILLIIFVAIFSVAFYEFAPIIFKAPSCSDHVQNGTELGIDCGDSCTNLCTVQIKIPTVLWSRSFPVTDTVYNAAAYIENKNNAATRAIPYEFRLYDPKGVIIKRVDGVASVPPSGHYAIVETGIQVGKTTVARTTFEFSSTPALWEHIPIAVQHLIVLTNDLKLDTTTSIPKLSATMNNPSPTVTLQNTVVAAILYDANDNAVNVSRTIVPTLGPTTTLPIYFTWPRTLSSPVVRFELLPIIDVFHTEAS